MINIENKRLSNLVEGNKAKSTKPLDQVQIKPNPCVHCPHVRQQEKLQAWDQVASAVSSHVYKKSMPTVHEEVASTSGLV